MNEFWKSDLGELTGSADDAFTKTFKQIPDGTLALARIEQVTNEVFENNKYIQVHWVLTDGEFKNAHVFQKIRAFDKDSEKRHKALNMLMLLYKLFNLRPASQNAPTNQELLIFSNKIAGIKIQLTDPNEKGRQYNWVSEVHPAQGFKSKSGMVKEYEQTLNAPQSALQRNQPQVDNSLEDDIPF